MNPRICTHYLASPSVVSLQPFSPSLPLLRGRRLLWGAHLSPVTPQLQTTTICCCCRFSTSQDIPQRLHMDYLFIPPSSSPVTFPVAFVLLTTQCKQQPKMKGLLICLKHPLCFVFFSEFVQRDQHIPALRPPEGR